MIEYLVNKKYFRNENHAIWFLCSIIFLLSYIIFKLNLEKLNLVILIIIHTSAFLNSSYIFTKKIKSEIYSFDCIWFNFLMTLIYLGFLLYF